jgi:hypothetical protein
MEEIEHFTIARLKKICHGKGIRGYSKLKKKDLIILIKTHLIKQQVKQGLAQLGSL